MPEPPVQRGGDALYRSMRTEEPLAESHGLTAYAPSIAVRAAGRLWRLERAADLETLWNAMTEAPAADVDDERLPYWTELWPSSVALANWLERRREDIAGRRCVDMGCGLGLTAMAGQSMGARVLALDYEAEAVGFAARNAAANACPPALWAVMDWRRPALRAGCAWRVWGGDIMYERRFVAPVLRFLAHVLAPGGLAWVAEPGRTVYESFLHALHGGGWQGRCVYTETVEPLYAQPVPVTVRVWEIARRRARD